MTSDRQRPFDAFRAALDDPVAPEVSASQTPLEAPRVRLDPRRTERTGVPEIIYAERKATDDVIEALARQADFQGRALASRCSSDLQTRIVDRLSDQYQVMVDERARAVVVAIPGVLVEPTGGRVGIISAGTSDIPIAAEAALIAREMGTVVVEIWDVGVAGLHRLVVPLESMMRDGIDALVVAAGMDGALPSVIAGLVDCPVIGLPTSVGYGLGAGGVGALTTMLQSCAPGLVVVNIDNGIGAGATAALIANRMAAARRGVESAVLGQVQLRQ